MTPTRYITIEEFSNLHGIEVRVLQEFMDFGLIHTHKLQEKECLTADDIDHAERLIRLYQDLGINKEGIEIILSMREQIISLNKELEALRHKINRLEQENHLIFIEIPQKSGLIVDHSDFG